MTGEQLLYLSSSVGLTVGRNIISKKIATDSQNKASFFFSQMMLFGAATVLLSVMCFKNLTSLTNQTLLLGLLYGLFLISAQWMYTLALGFGTTSVCVVVYAMGFLVPTVSGHFFWNEDFTLLNGIGVALAVAVILLSAKKDDKNKKTSKAFVPCIIVAMLSSGMLGILQKVHQMSKVSHEKSQFVIIGLGFAFLASLIAFLLCKNKQKPTLNQVLIPALAGGCFGGANFFNTTLAGAMKSAVFFPLQNISTVVFSALLGLILFREKLTLKTVIILTLGVAVILLFSI